MKIIKALTVWQPYASLIALGLKTEEIRRWWTRHRGPLAIHAGQQINRAFYANEEIYQALKDLYPTHLDLPVGRVLCLVNLKDIRNSLEDSAAQGFCTAHPGLGAAGAVELGDAGMKIHAKTPRGRWRKAYEGRLGR